MSAPAALLLCVRDLTVEFPTRSGTVHALEDVGFDVHSGETVGVVGESGSGKSVTAYAAMGLLDRVARVVTGRATFDGVDMLRARESEARRLRGSRISMVFQSPRAALNPIRSIGHQLEDAVLAHTDLARANARHRALELLQTVHIADPERRYSAYPFELSGGMCQRVMIALALAGSPLLLITDEPTTGLDVTTQAVIMDLVVDLAAERNMATLFITHDLSLAAEYCDRVIVMHAGHVVEVATTAALFAEPRHPYTQRLIAATPSPSVALTDLQPIGGNLPDLRQALGACRYSARCERYDAGCDRAPLKRSRDATGHLVACWKAP